MGSLIKKLMAFAVTFAMIASTTNFVLADESYMAEISDVIIENGIVTSAEVEVTTDGEYKLYVAVYENNQIKALDISNTVTASGNVKFDNGIAFDTDTQMLKCYMWTEEMKPIAKVYEQGERIEFTPSPTTAVTTEPIDTPNPTTAVTTEPIEVPTEKPTDTPVSPVPETDNALTYISQVFFSGGTASTDLTHGDAVTGYSSTSGSVTSILKASVDGVSNRKLEWTKDAYVNGDKSAVVPAMTAGSSNMWGENPYFDIELSTDGYTDIKFSAMLGASKKGPKNYKLQYSIDGVTYFDIENSQYSLITNKRMEQAFNQIALPTEADNCESLHIRIGVSDTYTVGGTLLSENPTGGEIAINNVKIYGTPENGEVIINTPQPEVTLEPVITYAANITLSDDGIDVDGNGATADGSVVTISQGGDYTVTGTLTDGQIVVALTSKSDIANVDLAGVNVTSTTGAPFCATKGEIELSAKKDTVNSFTSTAIYTDTDEVANACVYSKNDLTIKGKGTLNVSSAFNNGIGCKDDLVIKNATINVTQAENNGIKGNDSVTIESGTITVNSNGDAIKSDKEPELNGDIVEGGTVTIYDGNITVTTVTTTKNGVVSTSDGIQADMLLSIEGGTININSTGDAIKANASSVAYLEDSTLIQTPSEGDGCVSITGGEINISSGEDGIKAVKNVFISDGDITVTKAQEGIQVNEIIYNADETAVLGIVIGEININGGTLDITCSEDGIQCGTGDTIITNGDITVNSKMDCIQGENITNISGGTFNLTANGGAPQNISSSNTTTDSCKGVKAGTLIYISGGTLDINTYDDAIHSNNTVRILGGDITVASGDDGVHGDSYLYISDTANINVTKSYEGIEAAEIYISGGETRIVSTDDGANAAGEQPTGDAPNITIQSSEISLFAGGGGGNQGGNNGPDWGSDDSSTYGYLEVSGGKLYIEAEADGFDSNGNGLISGGMVLVNGPTSGGNGVFDIGDGNCTLAITGGTVIGAGTSDMTVTPTSSLNSQYYVVTSSSGGGGWGGQSIFSSQSAGKAFKLTNSSGSEIVTYVPSKTHAWIFVSTPDMTSGSYTLNYGGSVSDGSCWGRGVYGLVTGGTYTGSSTISLSATK